MMQIPYYHIDCFTHQQFHGNPAIVCLLQEWLPDDVLQSMAQEHAQPVTAFIVPQKDHYAIRWITPNSELDLCGHGSIAAAYTVLFQLKPELNKVTFRSALHEIAVNKEDDYLVLNFPTRELLPSIPDEKILKLLGIKPQEFYQDNTCLAVVESEQFVREFNPDISLLRQLNCRNLIITAPGKQVDFVSRNFYPGKDIVEDPVTGSAHCILAPYWAKRLGKNKLHAEQVSARGGELLCELHDDRVFISGKAVLYAKGNIVFQAKS